MRSWLLVSFLGIFTFFSLILFSFWISKNHSFLSQEKNAIENKITNNTKNFYPSSSPPSQYSLETIAPLVNVKIKDKKNYDLSKEKGAQYIPTADGKSYVLFWQPDNWQQRENKKIIISLHGRAQYATQDFALWYPYLKDSNFALASFEWWYGKGETKENFYSPQELYPQIVEFMKDQHVNLDEIILHGFSRGAVNTYGLKLLDNQSNNYFKFVFSDSGGILTDVSINNDILNGKYGDKPFLNNHWILYCGEKDIEPQTYGCSEMKRMKTKLEDWGAQVDLFIDDPDRGHTGFRENKEAVLKVLETFNQ